MKRIYLEHVLDASAAIAHESSFVVMGSQGVLLSHPNPPAELVLSNEVDLYPALHPERADSIEDSIGVPSPFHDAFGYHADGVGPDDGWVRALPRYQMIEPQRLLERVRALDSTRHPVEQIVAACAQRRIQEAQP